METAQDHSLLLAVTLEINDLLRLLPEDHRMAALRIAVKTQQLHDAVRAREKARAKIRLPKQMRSSTNPSIKRTRSRAHMRVRMARKPVPTARGTTKGPR
jgi:hypothetical protein